MLNLLAQLDYNTTTTTLNSTDTTTGLGALFAFGAVAGLILLAVYVVAIVAFWKMFEKAGIAGWKALIPIYNTWLLFEMAGKPGWWALVSIGAVIPGIGFIFSIAAFVLYILAALELGKAFKKDTTWTVLFLIIFNLVGLLILGFGQDKYTKPAAATAK